MSLWLLVLATVAAMTIKPLTAQTDRASITGTITDTSGARVPDVQIKVKAIRMGLETKTKTNGAGVFTISALPVGEYTAEIEANGFEKVHFNAITLNVGQTVTLDLHLKVASVTSEVDVTPTSELSRSSAEIGGVVNGDQIHDLPLNGRNYVSLLSMVPGAIDSGTGTQDQIRFAGLSAEDNNYHLDGIDMSGINHQYQKVNIRLQVSTEAIAEFRANSAIYSADQGGTAGGQVELVSKSGGEHFHGSAWDYLRNDYFDALPWNAAGVRNTLRLNDFGANLGGPIRKNSMFFFVNYEAIRQIVVATQSGTVPSALYRAAVLAKSPALAPILNAFPTGGVATSNVNVMQWYGSGRSTTDEDSGLARFDWRLGELTNVSIRANTDHFVNVIPQDLDATQFNDLNTPNAIIDVQHSFSPTLTNDVRFGFNRAEFSQGQTTKLPFSVSITGFSTLDNPSGSVRNDNSFMFADDATLLRGRHTIKTGVSIRRVQENKSSPNSPNEAYSFTVSGSKYLTSSDDFYKNLMDNDSYAGAVPVTGQRMTEYFGYILDQFQWRPNLTLNAGLRYEYFGVDHEVLARGIVVDPLSPKCPDVVCPAGTPWYEPNLLDLSPRLSLTWSPGSSGGKTVVRAGYGIYFGNGQFGNLGTAIGNLATKYTLTQKQAPGLSYPTTPYLGSVAYSFSPSGSPLDRRDTAVNEWSLSVQQEVASQTVVQVAYLANSAAHVFSDITLNGIDPATGARPYVGYSTIDYRGTSNHASTNALQAGLQRSMVTRLLISANYMWSHSIDNGGLGGGEAVIPQNQQCQSCERSSSSQDMRQYFTASTLWNLPIGRGRAVLSHPSAATDFVFGGWQLGGIVNARSGLPINVTMSRSATALPDQINKNQRPNLVPGQALYPLHQTVNHWFNAAAFTTPANGTWGNAGRNLLRAPGLWQLDGQLSKRFPVTERVSVNFRVEVFNLLNRAQYGAPSGSWNTATFGVITLPMNSTPTGVGTPRQLQFMLQANF